MHIKAPFIIVLAAALVAGCNNSSDTSAQSAPGKKAEASATAKQPAAREATYDPNLKPAQIVWDSPEKKAQWEARQAQLRQQQTAQPAQPAQPVQPPAPASAQ